MKLLIVEDNDRLRALIVAHLLQRGFTVDAVASREEALTALAVAKFDLVLLDLGLPDGDGKEVLIRARSQSGGQLPVVILTARDGLDERLGLLNEGADDFIVKPFDMLELEARIRAVLRRPGTRVGRRLAFGDLTFDVASREARSRSSPINLARRELGLLEELMRADARIVVREALEDRLYAFNEPVTPNALEQSISRLRRELKEAGSDVSIETKRGIGYRLTTESIVRD